MGPIVDRAMMLLQRAPQLASRGMDLARNAWNGPARDMTRMASGQMRNLSEGADRVIRLADGTITKLASGAPVPAGATILNTQTLPLAGTAAGITAGVGVPAALFANKPEGSSEARPEAPRINGDGVRFDASGNPTGGNPQEEEPRPMMINKPATPYRGGYSIPLEHDNAPMVPADRPADRPASNARPASAPQRTAPMQPERPADLARNILSSRQMYQAMDPNDERAGIQQFLQAAAQEARELKAAREAQGKAEGGAAGHYAHGGGTGSTGSSGSANGKDAALLKALEIIHHMLTRSR